MEPISNGELTDEAEKLPSVYFGIPWPATFVSTHFAIHLRNCFFPFPDVVVEPMKARNIADARNAIVNNAIEGNFDYVMMCDADQWLMPETFLQLYKGIKIHGSNTVATAWSVCSSGVFANQTSVYRKEGTGVVPIPSVELEVAPEYIPCAAFGTACFLAPTEVFKRIEPPWFGDVFAIREGDEFSGLLRPTEFVIGQDIYASNRLSEAGNQLIVATKARLPHERMTAI